MLPATPALLPGRERKGGMKNVGATFINPYTFFMTSLWTAPYPEQ